MATYGGTYQEVVKQKGDPHLTDDWQWGWEGKEWYNLLKEIGDSSKIPKNPPPLSVNVGGGSVQEIMRKTGYPRNTIRKFVK